MNDLIELALTGHRRSIARLITQVENSEMVARDVISQLYQFTGRAHIIGITGPPGVGKSSLVNELAKAFRQQEKRVGIIAVDPSSPFTGGALLGDRVRMRDLAGDRGIFMRSMASRGRLGGLAKATASVIKILDAGGFETILVETVGAGQAEVDIAHAAHTTLVIEAPGMGDDVQAIKAGILEIADILVVNKADRPGAAGAVKALQMMLHLGPVGGTRHHGRLVTAPEAALEAALEAVDVWSVPVQETISVDGSGVETLMQTIAAHRRYLRMSGLWLAREAARSQREIEWVLQDRFMAQFRQRVSEATWSRLITAVARRELDPYTAVNQLYERVTVHGERKGI